MVLVAYVNIQILFYLFIIFQLKSRSFSPLFTQNKELPCLPNKNHTKKSLKNKANIFPMLVKSRNSCFNEVKKYNACCEYMAVCSCTWRRGCTVLISKISLIESTRSFITCISFFVPWTHFLPSASFLHLLTPVSPPFSACVSLPSQPHFDELSEAFLKQNAHVLFFVMKRK